uniref:Ig-like domain-containing protein n=1 Tax=Trichobilharzia regenti TaxID=157069 RepID=A0AA85J8E2_TRIRE|nr:unnamed protein product [Trichobilharzia regenti]
MPSFMADFNLDLFHNVYPTMRSNNIHFTSKINEHLKRNIHRRSTQTSDKYSDQPEKLNQSIRIGYGFNKNMTNHFGSPYNCSVKKTTTICVPACNEYDSSRPGFVGDSLLWSFQSSVEGWTRIYDLVIRGVPFDENRILKKNIGDITLLKPYVDHLVPSGAMESCQGLLWHLNDESTVDESSTLRATEDRNVTIYFGKTYSVTSVSLMTSKQEETPTEYILHFNGMESVTKTVNLQNDCTLDTDGAVAKEYTCLTSDLESYAFEYVTVNVRGLYKFHVYGVPFNYPEIELIPSKENDKSISDDLLQLSCIAKSCDSMISYEGGRHRKSSVGAASCPMNGHIIRCEYLDLLRLSLNNTERKELTNQGVVNTEISSIMSELKVLESSAEKLVVTVPRTHQYYGQYQCSCQTTDSKKSQLFSPSTSLKESDFDQDFVFQKSYIAVFVEENITPNGGFIELPENEQEGYFKFEIVGHSLLKNIHLEVTFMENGQAENRTEPLTLETTVQAFPDVKDDSEVWSIPAYKYELKEAWPDAVDDNLVTITWSVSKNPITDSQSVIKDIFRTLVISPSGENKIRAWVWQRDSQLLDIRAYHQLAENAEGSQPKTLILQRTGCSSEDESTVVASVHLEGGQCNTENDEIVKCIRTTHGQVIQFTLKDPSTSDVYKLMTKGEVDESSVDLVTSSALGETVKDDIKDAQLSMTIDAIQHDQETQETEMDATVHIGSKVIADNVACRPTYILLEFMEPKIETIKSKVSGKQTTFRVKLPANQKDVSLEMNLLVGSVDPTLAEGSVKESVKFVNPAYISAEIVADTQNEKIKWYGLPKMFNNLLIDYNAKVSGFVKACEQTKEFDLPVSHQETENGTVYEMMLKDIPDSTITRLGIAVEYTVTVTPIFKGFDEKLTSHGMASSLEFSMGRRGQTELKAPASGRYHSIQVQVKPSQTASCLNMETFKTQFTLRVIGEEAEYPDYISQVNYVPITTKSPDTMDMHNSVKSYKIENLLPGRRYELQAEVTYSSDNFKDAISEPVRLWTEDEVHVQTEEIFVSPGERVVINCTGSVGPSGASQKTLEWKTIDGSRLPEGSRSLKTQEAKSAPLWYAMESLIFDSVNKNHAGVYTCFIRPSISELMQKKVELHNVTVTVSDLELDMSSKVADLGEKIVVTCRTASPGQLDWILPSGGKVESVSEMKSDESNYEPYSVKKDDDTDDNADKTDGARLSAQLVLPKVDLTKAGKYVCLHSPSNNKQTFNVQMKEAVSLLKSSESSEESGKTFILVCSANLGSVEQSVVWYKKPNPSSPWLEITPTVQHVEHIKIVHENPEETPLSGLWISQLEGRNSPASTGEYMCTIQNPQAFRMTQMELGLQREEVSDFSQITHSTITVPVKPVLKITQPLKLKTGQVHVQCQGYPAHLKDRLQWVYIPSDDATKVIPIVHLNPKDEEPEQQNQEKQDSTEEKAIDELVGLTFHLSDSTLATWPGSAGPQILAQSAAIEHENSPKQLFTPERLNLVFDNTNAEKFSEGTLSCRYLRVKGVLPMDTDEAAASLSASGISQTNGEDEILEKSDISMKDLFDAKEDDGISVMSNSINESDDLLSDGERNETNKKSISVFIYINIIALLIIFMQNNNNNF